MRWCLRNSFGVTEKSDQSTIYEYESQVVSGEVIPKHLYTRPRIPPATMSGSEGNVHYDKAQHHDQQIGKDTHEQPISAAIYQRHG
jgi:hypothetical protein